MIHRGGGHDYVPLFPSESVPDESSSRINRRGPGSRSRTASRLEGTPARERAGPGLTTEDGTLEDGEGRASIPETQPESELTGGQQVHHQRMNTGIKSPQGQACHESVSVSDWTSQTPATLLYPSGKVKRSSVCLPVIITQPKVP